MIGDPGALDGPARSSGELGAADALPEPRDLELLVPSGPVPLGFVREGTRIYLVASDLSFRWPIELLRTGAARLRIGPRTLVGAAVLVVAPEERDRAAALFRAKFPPDDYDRWYARPARVLRIDLADAGPPPLLSAEARYRRWVAAEFDNAAEGYDRQIRTNRISSLLRARSLALLRPALADAHRLLEIGCGSGIETVPMLHAGHEILCVDLSTAMLETVRRRARQEGVAERLTTRSLAAGDLARLLGEEGSASFDGAYSTYGALNCEPDLTPVAGALTDLLPPGGRFVAGVYNRWCAIELLGYGLTGQWRRAWARHARPVRAGSSRYGVDIYAYSPGDLFRAFAPAFRARALRAAPAILPPFDLAAYAEKFARRFDTLARWDARLAAVPPFSALGDHFLAVLERRGCLPPSGPARRPSRKTPGA